MNRLSTIADEWQRYDASYRATHREDLIPRAEVRHAFYAGASVMFALLIDGVQTDDRTIDALHAEVTQWLARMKAGPAPGSPS